MERNVMDNYDEGYLRIAEEKLEGTYNLALERARKTVPEAKCRIGAVNRNLQRSR